MTPDRSVPSVRHVLCLAALAALCLGCGTDEASTSSRPSSVPPTGAVSTSPTSEPTADDLDPDAPDFGRVISLAEEFILADVLTLGVEPIASSATVEGVGFQGLGQFDTSDIEVLPMTTLSLEYLASLQPDTIITLQFWVDQIGAELLEGIADVIVVPDGLRGTETLTVLGDLLGRPEHADQAIAEYEAALVDAQGTVGDECVVSLAAIYPGPSVAAFVDGPWEIPATIQALGCTLDPGAADAAPDGNGRAWLSDEQLGILDADLLVLMQSDTVEGEMDAVAEIEASPLWQTLPAVVADRVVVFDRLGYPGLQGQIRFMAEFSEVAAAR